MEIKLEQIKPFGPVILKVKIPEKILNDLNQYTDEVIADKEKSKKLDHGSRLVANATQEFRIEHDFAKKCGWANFLATCVSKWIEMSMKRKITKQSRGKIKNLLIKFVI